MSRLVAGGENCARDSLQMRLRQRQAAAAVVVGKMMRWLMRWWRRSAARGIDRTDACP